MGRDEPADFYIQELEELELDEEPTVTHDPLPNLPPAPRASGLAARAAPPPKTAEDLVKAAFQQQRAAQAQGQMQGHGQRVIGDIAHLQQFFPEFRMCHQVSH